MFKEGKRKHEWSTKNLLPMSGKLIPEFDRRRNIRDMFSRKPSLSSQKSFAESEEMEVRSPSRTVSLAPPLLSNGTEKVVQTGDMGAVPSDSVPVSSPARSVASKRAQKLDVVMPATKRIKSSSQQGITNGSSKGQQSLKGFFQAKSLAVNGLSNIRDADMANEPTPQPTLMAASASGSEGNIVGAAPLKAELSIREYAAPYLADSSLPSTIDEASAEASKQSWGKLFSKPISPNCEHGEPCKTMLTKKPGVNCGRSFWMCARPLGPSGNKEKNTEWRCGTFIWASDWTGTGNG